MKKSSNLYRFIDKDASFRVEQPERVGGLYFPLTNEEGLLSAITPDLHGDIKIDQHTFLTPPVSTEDLHLSRAARNFWIQLTGKQNAKAPPWSVSGHSAWQRAKPEEAETVALEAGFLWQQVTRVSKETGLEAKVLSFVPVQGTFEVMFVQIKNISKKPVELTATSAIPLYGRSADNLRDHRHVSSLLHRLEKHSYGIRLRPTMSFNERGHHLNETSFYVLGVDEKGRPPAGFFPTAISFTGEGGDLEKPEALTLKKKPSTAVTDADQGKEAMGALQFAPVKLAPGRAAAFTVLMGVMTDGADDEAENWIHRFNTSEKVTQEWNSTKSSWKERLDPIRFETGDSRFNQWIRWVQVQPMLRRIFGCSFLPDFDYGKGGRGWRDLWQDCLALLLFNPEEVRKDLLQNFGGVRLDGSNATVIRRSQSPRQLPPSVEFVADRNNIARTWMDHGIWPLLTAKLYIDQTGDLGFLLEKIGYFRDALIHRAKKTNPSWSSEEANQPAEARCRHRTKDGNAYQGTVLEHLLVETLVPFFNVGEHNIIRLEDADWNDGLDMAPDRGESVSFTALYGANMEALASLLELGRDRAGWRDIAVAEELVSLLDRVGTRLNYDSVSEKQERLSQYFHMVSKDLKGKMASIPVDTLAHDLREKAAWIKEKVNTQEWIEDGGDAWLNGYYDNQGRRVEGRNGTGRVHMTLTGQVFPIMAGALDNKRVQSCVRAVSRRLWDKDLEGIRLNTDFVEPQPHLGRAFSFAYGEKENGAVFSHMVVMYANALYQRGFSQEGFAALQSLYRMAVRTERSKMYPGLPEYFNKEGRGRYAYLTGSASWYVLTLLTQAFGVRGEGGDLVLAPQLDASQFGAANRASVKCMFAGAMLKITFVNDRLVAPEKARIVSVRSGSGDVPFSRKSGRAVLIQQEILVRQKEWELTVRLEPEGD